ncbi:MAG: hypothetical protein GY861_01830 [bacterium]|nr:hypothetical protein [bacterium]
MKKKKIKTIRYQATVPLFYRKRLNKMKGGSGITDSELLMRMVDALEHGQIAPASINVKRDLKTKTVFN